MVHDTLTVEMLPVELLDVDRENVRRRRPHVAELAASIAEQGVIVPLLVRPADDGRWTVVDGGTRLVAAEQAGLATVPCIVRPMSDRTASIESTTTGVARRALDPIEEGQAYRDALDRHQLTQDELGRLVGVSQGHISQRIKLLQLPAEVQDQVAAGDLSINAALKRLPKDPRRTGSHNYPAKTGPKRSTTAGTVETAERLALLDEAPPRGPVAPAGTTLVAVPNDVLDVARRAAASRKLPLRAWLAEAIRQADTRHRSMR